MPIYSHSRIGSFETCPLKYKFRYVDQIKIEREGVETFLGSRVHEAIQKIYLDLNNGKINSLDDILSFYRSSWERQWNLSIVITQNDLTADNYKLVGEKAVMDYYNRHNPFADGRTIGIEHPVIVDLNGDGEYKLRGYIDRLVKTRDGVYEIHDYKTNKNLPTQEEQDADRQLAIYQIGIQKEWSDVQDVTLVWHFVRFDAVIRSRRTPEELDKLRRTLIARIGEIEDAVRQNDFPGKKSRLCDYCEYKPMCPMWNHELSVELLPVNDFLKDDGVTLVNKYAELDTAKKETKQKIEEIENKQEQLAEAMFAYGEKNNQKVIVGSEFEVELKRTMKQCFPSKSKEPKLREDLETLLKKELIWKDVSDLATSKLKKLLDDNQLNNTLIAKLKPFLIQEDEKKVSMRKRKEEE
ncbi:MAG: RecB family exonuclease [Bacteroidota bacterium]